MLRPTMAMALFYIDAGTNLMDVSWVKQIREENEETSTPQNHYVHCGTCLYGNDPASIVQGKGAKGIYYKRCDERYVNALGEELEVDTFMDGDLLVDLPLEADEKKLAELAWRRHNPEDESDDDDTARPRRKFHCLVM